MDGRPGVGDSLVEDVVGDLGPAPVLGLPGRVPEDADTDAGVAGGLVRDPLEPRPVDGALVEPPPDAPT